MSEPFDSTAETLAHIRRVTELLSEVSIEVFRRGPAHDASKLEPPEKEMFDEVTPKLRALTFGSPEYKKQLEAMGAPLDHHYAHNRHHPQHFADGVEGMTLIDVMEMLADWKAATERHDDGDLARSLDTNQERFGISPQLGAILRNTAEAMGWL